MATSSPGSFEGTASPKKTKVLVVEVDEQTDELVSRALQAAGRPENSNADTIADDWPTLEALERRYIDRVLSRTANNKTRAAELLDIDRRTLNRLFARERAARLAAAKKK